MQLLAARAFSDFCPGACGVYPRGITDAAVLFIRPAEDCAARYGETELELLTGADGQAELVGFEDAASVVTLPYHAASRIADYGEQGE